MKRIRTAISFALMGTLSGVLTAPVTSNAEWVQNPIGVPRAPGCDPGYSWQKLSVRYQCATPPPTCAYGFASGPAWTGTAWSYSCNAPPPPSCPSGYYQAVAPSWNGSAWVGQQCLPNAPVQPPPLGVPCDGYPTPGYTPTRAYTWIDATADYGSGATNWAIIRQNSGVPANAMPYWASYDTGNGYSINWAGPAYPTCSGSGNYYRAVCWVDPGTNSVIRISMGAAYVMPQNGCGLQH